MRKITLVLAFFAAAFLLAPSDAGAKIQRQSVIAAVDEPTLDDAYLAFSKGQITYAPSKNVLKWLTANIPPEYWPVQYAKYKGLTYAYVPAEANEGFPGFAVFKNNGDYLGFINIPVDPV